MQDTEATIKILRNQCTRKANEATEMRDRFLKERERADTLNKCIGEALATVKQLKANTERLRDQVEQMTARIEFLESSGDTVGSYYAKVEMYLERNSK